MHGFDITQAHTANDWLNVHTVPFPVIPFGIGGQICDEICDPELKPGIHRHFGGGAVNVVLFFVLHIGQPIASLWKRIEMLSFAGTILRRVSCGVFTVFSLADAF